MKIRWESNFNMQDATVQLAVALVIVVSYENINTSAVANIKITDETGEIVAKEYRQQFTRTFANVDEVYETILPEFSPAEIV